MKLFQLHITVLCITLVASLIGHECSKNDVVDITSVKACPPATCSKVKQRLLWCCCGDSKACSKLPTECDDNCAKNRKSCC
ncbi:hypothetical protein R6Q59_003264 [Mikania micrantha]